MNTTLVQGLMHAVSRGESLQQAMMSFFNAGYSKEEIEEAAAEVQRIHAGGPATKSEQVVQKIEKVVEKVERIIPIAQPIVKDFKEEQDKFKQEVSRYEETAKPKSKGIPLWIILILMGVLFISLIVLWFVIFAK